MPPPRFTNPPPKTESARSAVKAFFCDLCQKGYARMNEWEAHEGSYDHQHRKRLKDLSRMQRDPNATSKARERERKEDERAGISGLSFKAVKLGAGAGAGAGEENAMGGSSASLAGPPMKGFKKGGFKSAFGAATAAVVMADDRADGAIDGSRPEGGDGEVESESDEEMYDPRRPTGCTPSCAGRI